MDANNPKYIIVHCSDVSYKISTNQFNSINTYHRDVRQFPRSKNGYYIGYHALITNNRLYRPKEDYEEGAHCNQHVGGLSMNFQSLGICIAFDGDVELPSKADEALLKQQIWKWQDKYNISNDRVLFHRDFAKDKTCPGALITRSWLSNLLVREVSQPEILVDKSMVIRLIEYLRSHGIIK